MTIELTTNTLQMCVCLVSAIWMTILAVQSARPVHILMAGFSDTFALGTMYWTTHQLMTTQIPDAFYLAEVSFMAAPLFLLCIEFYSGKQIFDGNFYPVAIPIYVVACGLWIFFTIDGGDGIANAMYMSATAICFAKAVQNLRFGNPYGRSLHLYCICFVLVEWMLWFTECIWSGDTWANPYYWVDNSLTLTIALIIPAVKGAWDYDLP
ncbi:hypothetical protein [Chakrabartyella piscis]|uniref:hypothetical protein n=1 Tax=Chakrabartyella piscis TaxID=2918914 RepID=UPI002958C247|nr:hypothetical protein [Chakrabartyella piscis]